MLRISRFTRQIRNSIMPLALVALTAIPALAVTPAATDEAGAVETGIVERERESVDALRARDVMEAQAAKDAETDLSIPEQVPGEHWAYRDVAELADKYGEDKRLSDGKPVSRSELVDNFIAALSRIVEKYGKEGPSVISRDDMESIRRLIVSLEDELFGKQAYRTIRTTIEQLLVLVEPAVPIFKYKVGVNGFLRGEGAGNFSLADLGYASGTDAGRLLYRVKPFVYWHPNQYLDVHLEGQGYGFTSEGSRHSHELNLYQGFVEAKLPHGDASGKNLIALKAGRQEFNYGSGFLLGADSFFDGLTFDAVRLRVQPSVNWFNFLTVDLLGGTYATPFSDGLRGNLWGAHVTYKAAEDSTIEGYAFRDTGSEDRQHGEHLDSVGYRSTSTVGMFALEHEMVYQFGKVFNPTTTSNDNIAAFGGHVDLTGEFPIRAFDNSYDSSVFLSVALGSGDKNAVNGNGSGKEFRNGNNDTSLVGDMSLVGDLSGIDVGDEHASGMQIFTVGWGIDLSKKLNFSATARKFMASKVREGFSRDVGVEADFTLTYAHNKDYTLILGYDHFFAGKFIRQASGSDRDINYAFAMLQFNYDWTKRKR